MPLPIVNFGYTQNQLQVNFVNLTINTTAESVYHWDFGDGYTSTEFEVSYPYSSAGLYNVKLTVTNIGEEPVTSERLINLIILPDNNMVYNIDHMIELYTPTGLEPEVIDTNRKAFFITKWQLYLQPLIEEPFKVLPENVFNPTFYPPLVNILIAKLVVMDIINANATEFLTTVLGEGGGSGSGGSGTSTTTQGTIKSIETGPTKVERYENKDVSSYSEKVSNLAKTYSVIQQQGGLMDQMKADVCQDADRVRVYLPMCGNLSGISIGLQIGKNNRRGSSHNANPFGVTKGML